MLTLSSTTAEDANCYRVDRSDDSYTEYDADGREGGDVLSGTLFSIHLKFCSNAR